MERAPSRPIMIMALERKRVLPDGLNIMMKERRRTEIVRFAISSILYKSSLLIRYSIIYYSCPVFNQIPLSDLYILPLKYRATKYPTKVLK
jgi:hypothetical protein